MPQPAATEVQAKLRSKYGNKAGSTITGGGKNAMRRKKFRQKKSTNEFEKRLQANLKKLSCNTIPGIEEVNLFKSDGTVIHFKSPKVDAEVSSNTFIVSGHYDHKKIEELLPDILPQIGSDHLTQLKDYAEKFEALKESNDDDADGVGLAGAGLGGDDGDVPMLIDEDLNFEQVAQSDEKQTAPAADDATADADATAADANADDATAAAAQNDEAALKNKAKRQPPTAAADDEAAKASAQADASASAGGDDKPAQETTETDASAAAAAKPVDTEQS
eukprot:CAMPEP_0202727992 /NCGR_PEP_ID=MMETSP1385-20130828/185401_1 /ASSEMBLY_ACC=CAM_ASM_000861 /TAXON_ID=933848 /ORGANISM="Elphidium margaritaceum" /LENGTH=275 /DNA_ID=CAMNT_0049394237 /DNA_START=81 /DNA_END=909 /DNA_ORIENTATION=-